MIQQNAIFRKRTVNIPFTKEQDEAFSKMAASTGLKIQSYVQNLVISDLQKNGWILQSQEENYAQGASK